MELLLERMGLTPTLAVQIVIGLVFVVGAVMVFRTPYRKPYIAGLLAGLATGAEAIVQLLGGTYLLGGIFFAVLAFVTVAFSMDKEKPVQVEEPGEKEELESFSGCYRLLMGIVIACGAIFALSLWLGKPEAWYIPTGISIDHMLLAVWLVADDLR